MENIFGSIKLIAVKVLLATLALFGVNAPVNTPVEQPVVQVLGADATKTAGLQTYYLSGSGVTSSASSITITSFTIPQNGTKILDVDLSDTFYLTLEPGNRTRQEFASCTTDTQNSDGSATFSGCTRGLSPLSPYTASTTLQFAHGGGSSLIFSNPPQLYDTALFKDNDETITGVYTFSASPIVPTPTSNTQAVNKSYVDGGVLAGAATSTESTTGISRLATKVQQASSTPTTTNTPYVLQAQNATSTPYSTLGGALSVVVSENDGHINQGWLDLTEAASITGQYRFSGATTTVKDFEASSTPANPIKLNGVSYNTPSTQGASSTILVNDGNGNLKNYLQDWHLIAKANFAGVATGTVPVSSTATRLKVFIYDGGRSSASAFASMTINGDTAANYGFQTFLNYVATGDGCSACSPLAITRNIALATTSTMYLTMDIQNDLAVKKTATYTGSYNLTTGIPQLFTGTTVWNNTAAQISSINFNAYRWGDATATWTDLRVEIYGNNP